MFVIALLNSKPVYIGFRRMDGDFLKTDSLVLFPNIPPEIYIRYIRGWVESTNNASTNAVLLVMLYCNVDQYKLDRLHEV